MERVATMKARILVIIGTLTLAIGFGIGIGIGSGEAAHAQETALCWNSSCLNAWNAGPEVNVYTTGFGDDQFSIITDTAGYAAVFFSGGGTYNDECVSDYGNSSTDARAGLDGDCEISEIAWGANFTTQGCTANGNQGYELKDVHWNGWLAPASQSDGAAFYLNNSTPHCFVQVPA
jgi:hypothetical protein